MVAQLVKNPPAKQETWVPSWVQEDPLEKGLATRSTVLAWNIPWREEPGGLQTMGLQESDTAWRLDDHQQTLVGHWEKKVLWDVPPVCGLEFDSVLPCHILLVILSFIQTPPL